LFRLLSEVPPALFIVNQTFDPFSVSPAARAEEIWRFSDEARWSAVFLCFSIEELLSQDVRAARFPAICTPLPA